jgi:hypothetical protein
MKKIILLGLLAFSAICSAQITTREYVDMDDPDEIHSGRRTVFFEPDGPFCLSAREKGVFESTTDYILASCRKLNPTLGVDASGNLGVTPGTYATASALTTALAAKANITHTHTAAQISDATGAGRSILTATDASAMRSLLGVASSMETSAAYYPLATNPAGYLTSVTPTQINAAIGFTPYSAANPAGYISASALTPYLTTSTASSTYATQSALTTGLVGKFGTPSGTTAQYLRGDGSLATFPIIPAATTINRVRATSGTDGAYVWTLPIACAVGQLPVVSVTPENGVANEVINHKITAISNTSVSIAMSRAILTLNGLLGLTIPIIQTSAGAQTVHLIAICP